MSFWSKTTLLFKTNHQVQMTKTRTIWFQIVNIESKETRVIALPVPDNGPAIWTVGTMGSGAAIEIAEPQLESVALYVLAGSNHLILQGRVDNARSLPVLGVGTRAETGEWKWGEPPTPSSYTLKDNKLYLRFDSFWLRIGEDALRISWRPLSTDGGTLGQIAMPYFPYNNASVLSRLHQRLFQNLTSAVRTLRRHLQNIIRHARV